MQKRLPLIIALVLGIIAVLMANVYLRQREVDLAARARARAGKQEQVGRILIAKQAIPRGTRIIESMIDFKDVPESFIQPHATRSVDRVVDKIAMADISKDEQILLNKVASELTDLSSLSSRTPPGKRAITIPVDNISSVGGMIRANDYVDVLGVIPQTGEVEGKKVTQYVTVPLFQKVLVLAVGSDVGTGASRRDKEDKTTAVNTITIALSPEEATMIAFVQEQGKLRFILRSPGDTQVHPVKPASWDTLFMYLFPELRNQLDAVQQQEPPPDVPEPQVPEVEIYRGTTREVVPLGK